VHVEGRLVALVLLVGNVRGIAGLVGCKLLLFLA